MLERVNAPAGLFDLRRHQLAALFILSELDKVGKHRIEARNSVVELKGSEREAVGEDIALVGGARLGLKLRNLYAHNVFGADLNSDLLLWREESRVESLLAHYGAGVDEVRVAVFKLRLNFFAKVTGLADQVKKLPHQLVTLVLEHFMSAHSGCELLLELAQLHARRIYV